MPQQPRLGGIAIPHAVEMDAMKTSIAVAISKNGIQWGSNTVYIIFLLAINKADKREFRSIYESLISLFSEPAMMPLIRSCTGFQDFEKNDLQQYSSGEISVEVRIL